MRAHGAICAVVAAGLALRLAMLAGLDDPLLTFSDANAYVRAADGALFLPLEGRTAGYPLFLRVLHDVWADPLLPVVVQHLLAVAGALALYAVAVALGVPRTLAALPAAVWLVPVDWLWLEHQLLTETLATALAAAALALAVLSPRGPVPTGVAVGVVALAAAIVRPSALALAPGLAVVLVLLAPGRRPALQAAGAFAATYAVLLGGYVLVQEDRTGFTGIVAASTDMGDYVGVAPLARCDRFTPPPGTERLCESTDPDDRPGTDHYYFSGDSPARRLLAEDPSRLPAIREWGARAAEAHRGAIWASRANALRRMFGLGGLDRRGTGDNPREMRLEGADQRPFAATSAAVAAYYGPEHADTDEPRWPYDALAAIQPLTRPPRLMLLAAFLLTVAGAVRGRAHRRAILAIAAVAWIPLAAATFSGGQFYTSAPSGQFLWRYALPAMPFVALAAVIAATALRSRPTR